MAKVTIYGPEGRVEAELGEHNTLGRHPDNTHQVLDRIVSKEHCHIDRTPNGYTVRDLGSLNGTYVNGERIEGSCVLADGDEINIGSSRVVFSEASLADHERGPQTNTKSGGEASRMPRPQGMPTRDGIPTPHARARALLSTGAQKEKKTKSQTVTIDAANVQSKIQSTIAPSAGRSFLPVEQILAPEQLRSDYEKLRASYMITRAVNEAATPEEMFERVLDATFELLSADRGVVLLYDKTGELTPRAVRTRSPNAETDVLISNTIVEAVVKERAAVLSNDATTDSRFGAAKSIIMQGIRSSMTVPLMQQEELFGIMVLDSQLATGVFTEKDLQLFQTIADQASVALQNQRFAQKLKQEAITRERFQRLLSPAIAEQVISGELELKQGGELREATVLFSDIRGFTSMSESMPPQEVVAMLNEYFELMVDLVFANEGTLDKFVGDEIMVLYGAPVGHADDPLRAVTTAHRMQEVISRQLNPARQERNLPPIHVGIGINTGPMVAGYLGSSQAMEYTVIGDSVNTAARLCSLAKGGEVIISESTYNQVKDSVDVIALDPQSVKGKAKALQVYSVQAVK